MLAVAFPFSDFTALELQTRTHRPPERLHRIAAKAKNAKEKPKEGQAALVMCISFSSMTTWRHGGSPA
jgi:hypothetical protein